MFPAFFEGFPHTRMPMAMKAPGQRWWQACDRSSSGLGSATPPCRDERVSQVLRAHLHGGRQPPARPQDGELVLLRFRLCTKCGASRSRRRIRWRDGGRRSCDGDSSVKALRLCAPQHRGLAALLRWGHRRRRATTDRPQRGPVLTHRQVPSLATARRHRVLDRGRRHHLRALPKLRFGPRFCQAPLRLGVRTSSQTRKTRSW
jgi:hypothetical protein